MKPGPVLISKILFSRFDITAPPRPITDHILDVVQQNTWYAHVSEAQEVAEKWAQPVLNLLRTEVSEFNRVGRVTTLAFNSSSPDHLQGAAFIEAKDSPEVQAAKKQRAQLKSYRAALESLKPREFEALCVGILRTLGVDEAVLTQYSADAGIDFYGRLRLETERTRERRRGTIC
jgi:Restriction endonuclease